MSPSKPYHHGDLRAALIDAALVLLPETGVARLSLRAIARKAGVSQTAPYSHFKNKEALLAAVAAVGFQKLSATMAARAAQAESPSDQLRAFGIGYVRFALDNPTHFRLMFGREAVSKGDDATLAEASDHSFDMLSGGIAAHLGDGPDQTAALAAWSLVHGLSELMLNQQVARPADDEALVAMVDAVLGNLFAGPAAQA